jgi:hypothetical protein
MIDDADFGEGPDGEAMRDAVMMVTSAPLPHYMLQTDDKARGEGRRVYALHIASQFDVMPDEFLKAAREIDLFIQGKGNPAEVHAIDGGKKP